MDGTRVLLLIGAVLILAVACSRMMRRDDWDALFVGELPDGDCASPCLAMVFGYHRIDTPFETLRRAVGHIPGEGAGLLGISDAAERFGFRTLSAKIALETLTVEAPLPAILHWNGSYFVVLISASENRYEIAHPRQGRLELDRAAFLQGWALDGAAEGIALFFEQREDAGRR